MGQCYIIQSSWSQELLFLNFRKAFSESYSSTFMTRCAILRSVVKLRFKVNQPIYYLFKKTDFDQAIELLVSSLALAKSAALTPRAIGPPAAAIRVDGEDTLL